MRSIHFSSYTSNQPAGNFSALKLIALFLMVVSIALTLGTPSAEAQPCTSQPLVVGYRDFSYNSGNPLSEITQTRPESKLWWNDGFWWASLWSPAFAKYRIHRFDLANQCWTDVGPELDDRAKSLADALWDGQYLYIASHIYTDLSANTTPDSSARLYRYSYDAVAKTYSLDAGFPVIINSSRSETLVLTKDGTGKLWVTWAQNGKVMVNSAGRNDLTWGTPFILPVQGNDLHPDDIASVIAFAPDKIGILWSNQIDKKFYFAVHLNNKPDTDWEPREEAYADATLGGVADDHISLACNSNTGTLVAAVKTGLDNHANKPLISLLKRAPNGAWTNHTVGKSDDGHTSPIVLINSDNDNVYVIAKGRTNPIKIYIKNAHLSNPQFPAGLGTPFIESTNDLNMNNPTATKQSLNATTGLLALASDRTSKFYVHNYLDLSAASLPSITAFSPSAGPSGTEVTITGTNFLGTKIVSFNGMPADTFFVDSATQIRAVVPQGVSEGKIIVSTAVGSALSATAFTLTIPPLTFTPIHDAFVRSSFPTSSYGTATTLRQRVTSSDSLRTYLKFNLTGLSGLVQSAKLRLFVMDGSNDGGAVYAVSDHYKGTTTPWVQSGLTWENAPAISSAALSMAPQGGVSLGSWVEFDVTPVIVGNGIYSFVLKNNSADIVYYSSKEGVNVPELIVRIGSASQPAPTITSFAPTSGGVGTEVTITGTNLGGATTVTFNGTPASTFTVDLQTQLRAVVPAGATTGKISVSTAGGTATSAQDFAVFEPPTITSFTPIGAPVGAEVTIIGTGFTGTTEVSFNDGATATFVVDSDTRIRANVPTAATNGKIRVTNPAGSALSPFDFIITVPPAIFTFSPIHDAFVRSSLPTSSYGGVTTLRQRVTSSDTLNTYLKFNVTGLTGPLASAALRLFVMDGSVDGGAVYAVSNEYEGTATPWTENGLTWDNAPTMRGTALSTAGGASVGRWVELEVTAAIAGEGMYSFGLKNATVDVVYYSSKEGANPPELVVRTSGISLPAPTIVSFTPTSGPVETEVTITGTNFAGATEVTFSETPANFIVDSATQIRATVPAGAPQGGGKISVTTPGGTTQSADDFMVTIPPTISSYSPTSGPVGIEVTITGAHFTGTTSLSFNGTSATFVVDSDTQIRANVPPGATTGKIKVINSAGSALSATNFIVTVPPGLFSFAPLYDTYVRSAAPTNNFGSVTTLRQRLSTSDTLTTYLKFNVTGLSGTVQSAKFRLFVVFAGNDGGAVYLVSNNYKNSATPWAENGLKWNNAPVINGTPLSSAPQGGVSLGIWVEWDVKAAIIGDGIYSFGLKNASIEAVQYSSKEGTNVPELLIQTVILPPVPTIASFTPTSGASGTEVTITGAHFSGATNVSFNDTPAPFVVDSDNQLRATVPVDATTGKISLTTPGGAAISVDDFTVPGAPATFSFTPLYDTYIRSAAPTNNYGSLSVVRQRLAENDIIYTYLKFIVTGLSGMVQSAKLRLYVSDASDDGGSVYGVSNNYAASATPWTENGLKWSNAPSMSSAALSSAGTVSVNTWVELDVTVAVTGDGIYSFGLKNTSADAVFYSSKEGVKAPELIIQTGAPQGGAATASKNLVITEILTLPEQFSLFPNYPNPFNAHTTIEYALPQESQVRLVIYDALGQSVRTLIEGIQPAGYQRAVWDGRNDSGGNVRSGVYFCQLEIGLQKFIRKMILQQ